MTLVVLVGCRTNLLDGGGVEVPLVHRANAVACSAPGQSSCTPMLSRDAHCQTGSDCVSGLHGRCETFEAGCSCTYDDCAEDGDCPSTQLCSCGDPSSRARAYCADTNCHTDADCGAGGYCSPSESTFDILPAFWHCHTAFDTCVNNSDCRKAGERCVFVSEGYWGCVDYEQ